MTDRHPALATAACRLFGVRYPIVQTGMGFVSDARLTAATARAGGLGILSTALLDDEESLRAVAEVRERIDAPFGVNLRPDQPGADRRVARLIEAGVRVVSFAGAPRPAVMAELRDAGAVALATVGSVRHARKVADLGVDAVIVQGGEGGGHTGRVPSLILLQQVAAAVDLPIIAAGGFHSGRALVAALALGASGIAMGTRFLLTRESPVADAVKQVYLDSSAEDTVRTSEIDGMPQRILATAFARRLDESSRLRRLALSVRSAAALRRASGAGLLDMLREGRGMRRSRGLSWSQVLMAANAPMLYRAGLLDGRPQEGVLGAGQVVGLIDDLPSVGALVERIVAEAESALAELAADREDGEGR